MDNMQLGVNRIVEISRDEIRDRLNDSRLTVVNVLPRETFVAARIPGSINLPVAEIGEKAPLGRQRGDVAGFQRPFAHKDDLAAGRAQRFRDPGDELGQQPSVASQLPHAPGLPALRVVRQPDVVWFVRGEVDVFDASVRIDEIVEHSDQ